MFLLPDLHHRLLYVHWKNILPAFFRSAHTVFEHFQVKLLLCSPKLSHTVIVSFLWTFFFWFQSCVKLAIHIYGLKLFDPFLYEQTEIECNGVENGDVTKNTFPLKAHSQYL